MLFLVGQLTNRLPYYVRSSKVQLLCSTENQKAGPVYGMNKNGCNHALLDLQTIYTNKVLEHDSIYKKLKVLIIHTWF